MGFLSYLVTQSETKDTWVRRYAKVNVPGDGLHATETVQSNRTFIMAASAPTELALPDTHLAAVLEQFNAPYTLKQVPTPPTREILGHDILIRVLAASYCHTDSVFAAGGLSQQLPRIGCHEFAGEVVAMGADVQPGLGLSLGVRVGVPGRAFHPCGSCFECTNPGGDPIGYSPYCPHSGNLGLTRDGGFQEYCLVDSRQVAPLPAALPSTQAAALMCAGLTVWAALHHPQVQKAKSVAIMGAGGGLGHLGVQFAAHLGFEVLAVDANEKALELLGDVKASLPEDARRRVHEADVRRLAPEDMVKLLPDRSSTGPGESGVEAVILLPDSQVAFDTGGGTIAEPRDHGGCQFPKGKATGQRSRPGL